VHMSSEVPETDCAQFSGCKHLQKSEGLYTSTRPSARNSFIASLSNEIGCDRCEIGNEFFNLLRN
jgi:hypothetical protein